jgi:putative transposase
MHRIPPSKRMEQAFFQSIFEGKNILSGMVQAGAQLMLQKALEEEVTVFLGRGHYKRGKRLQNGYRNGYEPAAISSSEGKIEVELPQTRETEFPFRSVILELWQRRSENLEKLIPALYVKGLSQRDIERALKENLGVDRVSRSVVSKLSKKIYSDFDQWRKRDLSGYKILYLFLDSHYLVLRQGTDKKEGVLVAWGVTEDGKKVLLHIDRGERESYDCWKTFVEDMKLRGLNEPLLVIRDGNSGLKKTARECFSYSFAQRCQVHKMRNILSKLPRDIHAKMKRLIHSAFYAKDYPEGLRIARDIIARFEDEFPSAMECLAEGLEETLCVLKFPAAHRKSIRSTNLLERLLGESKRRTKVIPRFPTEKSCLSLVYAVLIDASSHWHGLKMTPKIIEELSQLRALCRKQKTAADEPVQPKNLELVEA